MKNNISILLSRVLAFFVLLAIVAQPHIGAAAPNTSVSNPETTATKADDSDAELNGDWEIIEPALDPLVNIFEWPSLKTCWKESMECIKSCPTRGFNYAKSWIPSRRTLLIGCAFKVLITALYVSGYDYGTIDMIIAEALKVIPLSAQTKVSCWFTQMSESIKPLLSGQALEFLTAKMAPFVNSCKSATKKIAIPSVRHCFNKVSNTCASMLIDATGKQVSNVVISNGKCFQDALIRCAITCDSTSYGTDCYSACYHLFK